MTEYVPNDNRAYKLNSLIYKYFHETATGIVVDKK